MISNNPYLIVQLYYSVRRGNPYRNFRMGLIARRLISISR